MAESDSALVIAQPSEVQLGTLNASTPGALVAGASILATTLAGVIDSQKLYTMIQGRKHVRVEGWTTLAVMLGCTAREVANEAQEDGSFVATVELVRMKDGVVVARATAECGMDEPTWKGRARYARRSMAATRATGKACRLAFSWIMALAGFDPTPLEEMPHEEPSRSQERDVTPQRAAAPAAARTDMISDPQRKRLLAISYQLGESAGLKRDQIQAEVKAVIGRHGYDSTKAIKREDYDAIVAEASQVLRAYAEPTAAPDPAADLF